MYRRSGGVRESPPQTPLAKKILKKAAEAYPEQSLTSPTGRGGGRSRLLSLGSPSSPGSRRGKWAATARLLVLAFLGLAFVGLVSYLVTARSRMHTARMLTPDWVQVSSTQHWAATAAAARRAQQGAPPPAAVSMETYDKIAERAGKDGKPMRLKYPVVWQGPFRSHSGYGTEALSFISGLLDTPLLAPEDLWLMQKGDEEHAVIMNSMPMKLRHRLEEQDVSNITKRLSPQDRDRPIISICHCFPDCWRSKRDESWLYPWHYTKALERMIKQRLLGKPEESGCPCPDTHLAPRVVYKIGRSTFETEALPRELAAFTELLDEVWVPTEFSVGSFNLGGVDPGKLLVLPESVDTNLFDRVATKHYNLSTGQLVMGTRPAVPEHPHPFRFLSIFKWEMRKGWPELLQAYTEEFKGSQPVELHIVTKPVEGEVSDFPAYIRKVAAPYLNITHPSQYDSLPRVFVHAHHIPETQFPGLYKAANALVLPTHGEGWGRPQIEAMAMALPVISTNWSGVTAYLSEQVGYPLRVEAIVEAKDEGANSFGWFKHQRWAQPSKQHLRQLMHTVIHRPAQAAAKGAAARKLVLRQYTLSAVARKLLAHLLRVQDAVDKLLQTTSYTPMG